MPRQLKDYDLVIDYAAFMLAIVFARHLVDHSNVQFQWSAETLSENMKKLEFGSCANFAVNSTALSHGFHLFGTPIKDRGIERVIVQREGSAIPKYFTLDGHSISHEIKFTTLCLLSDQCWQHQENYFCPLQIYLNLHPGTHHNFKVAFAIIPNIGTHSY